MEACFFYNETIKEQEDKVMKRKQLKRLAALSLALTLGASGLTGCSGTDKKESAEKDGKIQLRYALMLVPINVGIALILALLLNGIRKGAGFFKTVFYIPTIISGVALALIWSWILKDNGILNQLLAMLGIEAVPWLRSPRAAMWAIVLTTLWAQGSMMLVFLSALKGVPQQVVEAAEIDGARGFKRFWKITLPLISPTLVYNLIMAIIASFQQLTVVMNLTNGGPSKSTYMYSLFIYENAFKKFKLGYAVANAWVMFLVILAMTGAVLAISRKWTYYEV